MRSLADMPEDEYQLYIVPLYARIKQLEEKAERDRRETERMVAAIVEAAGGEVRIPRVNLLRDDDLELWRSDDNYDDEIRFVAKRRELSGS